MQRNMSDLWAEIHMWTKTGHIPLHPLQEWQSRFLCRDSHYFWDIATIHSWYNSDWETWEPCEPCVLNGNVLKQFIWRYLDFPSTKEQSQQPFCGEFIFFSPSFPPFCGAPGVWPSYFRRDALWCLHGDVFPSWDSKLGSLVLMGVFLIHRVRPFLVHHCLQAGLLL